MKQDEKSTVIMKECHCPYCEKEKAILINKEVSRKWSLQYPAYGLKFMFSIIFLSFIYVIRYGMKIIEIVRKTDILTYCFCPECGNSYSLNPPKEISDEIADEKLYKIREGRLIKGICNGISVLTDIPLLWIRICSTIYGIIEVYLISKLVSAFKYTIFSYEICRNDVFSFFWGFIAIVVGIALVIGEYILFSLLLKEKKSELEDE